MKHEEAQGGRARHERKNVDMRVGCWMRRSRPVWEAGSCVHQCAQGTDLLRSRMWATTQKYGCAESVCSFPRLARLLALHKVNRDQNVYKDCRSRMERQTTFLCVFRRNKLPMFWAGLVLHEALKRTRLFNLFKSLIITHNTFTLKRVTYHL